MADSDKKKYNIIDSFNVSMNKGFFHCERREALKLENAEFESKWIIRWSHSKDEAFPNATFNLLPNLARTAVFQFIDRLKLYN